MRELLEVAFAHVHLDWRDHVDVDAALLRLLDVDDLVRRRRARAQLGWRPTKAFADMVVEMTECELERAAREAAIHAAQAAGRREA